MSVFVALLVLAQAPLGGDDEPPIIEDVAAAASNPMAAPVITVLLSDRGSGVASASVFFRPRGGMTYQKMELKGGASGMFIARLPQGLQKTGFDYYVEATDLANNQARIASAEAPIRIDKAAEPTSKKLERQQQAELLESGEFTSIHPAWVMLSLGVGVLAGAGTGAYVLDATATQSRVEVIDNELAREDLTEPQRARLVQTRGAFETAILQDTLIASVLGVVAAAGVVTGTALLIASAAE